MARRGPLNYSGRPLLCRTALVAVGMTAPFADLLERARRGDSNALAALASQYEPEVRVMARVLLGPALRPYLDSLDLVQSVHRSLLAGLRHGKIDLTNPQRLVALALTMVRRKIARQWRRHQRQERPVGGDAETLADRLATLCSAEDDPARRAERNDSLRLVCRQLTETERRLIELRLNGCSTIEAAGQLGLDADVLRVRLSRLRQRLQQAGILEEFV